MTNECFGLKLSRVEILEGNFITELVLFQQVHHVWLVVPQRFNSMKDVDRVLLSQHLTDNTDTTENTTTTSSVPAVDHGASLPAIVLLLPFVHLMNQFEEGTLRHWRVPVHGPAQELELLHHTVPVLRPG